MELMIAYYELIACEHDWQYEDFFMLDRYHRVNVYRCEICDEYHMGDL